MAALKALRTKHQLYCSTPLPHACARLYHAAAVMAGNFTATIMAEASLVLASAGVDPQEAPRILEPLAMAAINNAARSPSPVEAITGPFPRGDTATIEAHLAALTAENSGKASREGGSNEIPSGEAAQGNALVVYKSLGEATARLLEQEGKLDTRVAAQIAKLLDTSGPVT